MLIKMLTKKTCYEYSIVGLIYLFVAFALFLPIISNPVKTTLGATYDVYQNMWNYWWVGYSLSNHLNLYYTKLLEWPVGANLAYMTLQPITGILSLPFQAVSLPFAYNVMFFLGFLISGIGAYALAKYITNDKYAAFLGGFVFTFSAFHIAQSYGHGQWFFIGWIALFIYFFIKMIETKGNERYFMGIISGVMLVLVVLMGDVEPGLITFMTALAILAAYILSKEERKKALSKEFAYAFAIMVLTAAILGSWGFYPILKAALSNEAISIISEMNSIQNNMAWSDNLLSFFLPSYYNSIFNGLASHEYYFIYSIGGPQDRIAYIGYTALALALYGAYRSFKKSKLWIAIGMLFLLLALGPFVEIGPFLTPIPTLYLIYHAIPLINFIREPGRFDVIIELAIAMLAAIGFASLREKMKWHDKKSLYAAMLILCTLYIIESAGIPINSTYTPHIPQFIKAESTYPGNFSTLILPALPQPNNESPAEYMSQADYYTTVLHKPILGGYITRENATQEGILLNLPIVMYATSLQYGEQYITPVKENLTVMGLQTLLQLENYNTYYVILENKAFKGAKFYQIYGLLRSMFSKPIYQSQNITVFFVPNLQNQSYITNYTGFFPLPIMESWAAVTTREGVGWLPLNGQGIIEALYKGPQNSTYNMHIRFEALSQPHSKLYIGIAIGNTLYKTIYLNTSSELSSYQENVSVPYSQIGYIIAFIEPSIIYSNGKISGATFLYNITIT
ncbi:MAG: hypothetical protein ACP5JN_03275 [Candidatus Micrarchaeia archaeon]